MNTTCIQHEKITTKNAFLKKKQGQQYEEVENKEEKQEKPTS